MSAQTLIFCVGANKAGTSWLHSYLRSHEDCHFRNLKELHYFDALDEGGSDWHQRRQARRLDDLREKLANHRNRDTNTWLPRLIADIEEWVEKFDGKTADDAMYLEYIGYGQSSAKVVGDITPAYGQGSTEMLAHMAALGLDVKFIFLMRDPVDRLWSNMRMVATLRGNDALETQVADYLDDRDTGLTQTSDYQGMLERLLAVIPRENLHLEFFERLFTQEALDRICSFLGIKPAPADFERVVHRGKKISLPSILRTELESKLKPQYGFVEGIMGGLPREWTENMVSA